MRSRAIAIEEVTSSRREGSGSIDRHGNRTHTRRADAAHPRFRRQRRHHRMRQGSCGGL